jgi:hypothetical protein
VPVGAPPTEDDVADEGDTAVEEQVAAEVGTVPVGDSPVEASQPEDERPQ